MNLKESKVRFFEDEHRYELGDLPLQGITSTLIPALFGNYTANIPGDVLTRAAERGTAIHHEIAAIDAGKSFASEYETMEYVRLRDELGLIPVASEYIVTDGKHFASAIDKVFKGDIIADIKTTSEVHFPEVSFQLSWYACYYKHLNHRQVSKAYVIWLPKQKYGACEISEIPLQSAAIIHRIVKEYVAGHDIKKFAHYFEPRLPAKANALVAKLRACESRKAKIQEEIDKMKQIIIDAFNVMGVKKFENDLISITRIEASRRTTLDSRAVQSRYPDIYNECRRESELKSTIRLTIKD